MHHGLVGNRTVKFSYLKMGKRSNPAAYWLVRKVALC